MANKKFKELHYSTGPIVRMRHNHAVKARVVGENATHIKLEGGGTYRKELVEIC